MLSPNPRDSQPPAPGEVLMQPNHAGEPSSETKDGLRLAPFAAIAAVIAALVWSYWPNLRSLVTVWNRDPNYSHGYLVIPVALFIFWRRWTDAKISELRPSPWGWAMLVV